MLGKIKRGLFIIPMLITVIFIWVTDFSSMNFVSIFVYNFSLGYTTICIIHLLQNTYNNKKAG